MTVTCSSDSIRVSIAYVNYDSLCIAEWTKNDQWEELPVEWLSLSDMWIGDSNDIPSRDLTAFKLV